MRRAFTLIELLVVIAIIAILAGLLFSVFARAKASAKQSACLSNLKQVATATQLYMSDNDDMFPQMVDASDKYDTAIWTGQPQWLSLISGMPLMNEALQPYATSPDIFHCPSDTGTQTLEAAINTDFKSSPSMFKVFGSSYLLRTEIAFRQFSATSFALPSNVNVFFDGAGNWHGSTGALEKSDSFAGFKENGYRYNVVFADWHAKNLSYSALQVAWNTQF